jgi:predicted phage terminase large subunit-like protein
LADYLKEEHMAVNPIKTNRDKVTRLLEYQWEFESGNIFFNTKWCEDLIEELLAFPNWEFDDMVDSLMLSFWEEENEWVIVA